MNPLRFIRDRYHASRLRAELRQLVGGSGFVPAAPILSGTFVTPETALCLTAVFCAVNVISRDVAAMDRYVSRKLGDGGYDPIDDHPLNELLQIQTDEEHDGFRFFQQVMSHVLLRGNGYAEVVRDASGYPQQLVPLHPVKTLPRRTKSGTLYYELENKETLAPEDVLHFAGLGFDGLVGYSPITCARQSIGLAIAAEQYGASYFGNSAVPKGVLQTPRRLSEAAVNNLRRSWNQVHQGSQSAAQVAILEEGTTWQSTQISPEDAQFLQTRKFQLEDVARLFGLPPNKIGEMTKAHLSNVEESNLDYLSTTLQGWLTMVERELNRKLLSREDRKTLRITTDVTLTLRGNTAARTSYYQTMRNLGAMSANDIRRREGMRPIDARDGGDLYLVQAQYQPLDQAGGAPGTPVANGRSYRFNENHDPKSGEFSFGEGKPAATGDAGKAPTQIQAERQLGVKFAPDPSTPKSYVTVVVDVQNVDRNLQLDKNMYVGPKGSGAGIDGRYENFTRFLGKAKEQGVAIEQPRMVLADKFGNVSVSNGRHRWAVFRDQGATFLPVSVPKNEAAKFVSLYGAFGGQSPAVEALMAKAATKKTRNLGAMPANGPRARRFNPNHDAKSGQFSFGSQAPAGGGHLAVANAYSQVAAARKAGVDAHMTAGPPQGKAEADLAAKAKAAGKDAVLVQVEPRLHTDTHGKVTTYFHDPQYSADVWRDPSTGKWTVDTYWKPGVFAGPSHETKTYSSQSAATKAATKHALHSYDGSAMDWSTTKLVTGDVGKSVGSFLNDFRDKYSNVLPDFVVKAKVLTSPGQRQQHHDGEAELRRWVTIDGNHVFLGGPGGGASGPSGTTATTSGATTGSAPAAVSKPTIQPALSPTAFQLALSKSLEKAAAAGASEAAQQAIATAMTRANKYGIQAAVGDPKVFRTASVPAKYSATTKLILINPAATSWGNPGVTEMLNKKGYLSSASANHTINHEMGHAFHHKNVGDQVMLSSKAPIPQSLKSTVMKEVSQYAATNKAEMVAEVFAGIVSGKTYSPAIMKAYKEWGGPAVTAKAKAA